MVRTTADASVGRVSGAENSWQQGDPMCDAIGNFLQVRPDQNQVTHGYALDNPEGYARRVEDLPAILQALDDSKRC